MANIYAVHGGDPYRHGQEKTIVEKDSGPPKCIRCYRKSQKQGRSAGADTASLFFIRCNLSDSVIRLRYMSICRIIMITKTRYKHRSDFSRPMSELIIDSAEKCDQIPGK